MATIALLIAQEGFQTKEYGDTKHVLENAGHKVLTVSMRRGAAVSNINEHVLVDLALADVVVANIDGFYIIGGPGALRSLDNVEVYRVLEDIKAREGMPYGAICVAPRILAKGKVLFGLKATGWNADNKLPEILSANGAVYVDAPVVEDGRVTTADGPASAAAFGAAIAKRFAA